MGAKDGRKKVIGPVPTLFVGIGPCAERTLAEFSRLARHLIVPVQGPFGLVLVDSYCEELFKCDWPWVCDFKIPEATVLRERSEYVGRDDGKLLTSLSSLVRRLRSVGQVADPSGPGRLRMNCTVLLGLSESGAAPSAIRLMQMLRKADPALDVTVLGLTDRTAATDSACDGQWFEVWKRLLAELQDEPLAQRVYLLDGCDADRMWFERPEQLHRLGAEFLLYHGLICRTLLRQGERARTTVGESLLNVCGSFGCRTIHADLSIAAERIAEKVAAEDLFALYKRPLPDGWAGNLDEQAQSLVDRIASLSARTDRTRPASSNDRRHRSNAMLPGSTEVDEAIGKTVKHVCSREPLASLCHFFKCLQPRLGKLLTRQRLWERARVRRFAAEALRRQEGSTYEPMRIWLSRPETRWMDRFTPKQAEVSHVVVGRPASRREYVVGMVLLGIGLISVFAGLPAHERLFVIGGGLLSLAASVLMTLPTGWLRYPRHRVREGQEVSASAPTAPYRKRASRKVLCVATLLILAGLVGLTWPLWPAEWTSITSVGAVALAVIAGVGMASVMGCPSQTHPEQVGEGEAPGHVGPPAWRCRAMGILCLALAWIVLCLGFRAPTAPETTAQWVVHVAGLALVFVGVGWALLPRVGYAYLVDFVPTMPMPLAGGIGHPPANCDLGHRLAAIAGWIGRLTLESEALPGRSQTMSVPRDRETLFDFLAADWEEQLAKAFRLALANRSGKSLTALAQQPVLWAECILNELQDPSTTCRDLASLFTLKAVKAWIKSHTMAELLSFLEVDAERFARLATRLAPAQWPPSRTEPDMSVSAVAVAKPLWDLLAPLAESTGSLPIVPLDWDARSDAIVVVRIVQGLAEGWRGYPGMPGQLREGVADGGEKQGP